MKSVMIYTLGVKREVDEGINNNNKTNDRISNFYTGSPAMIFDFVFLYSFPLFHFLFFSSLSFFLAYFYRFSDWSSIFSQ